MLALALIVLLSALATAIYWHRRIVRETVERWAGANNYRILEWHYAWLPPLGMTLSSSDAQVIVQIRIYDETASRVRSGWLRLGSYWGGLAGREIPEVRWATT